MSNKKQLETILFLLQRSQITMFRQIGNKIASFSFSPELVADLEVKDENKLVKSFETFLAEQKVPPSNVVFLLDSSVYFTQQIELYKTLSKGTDSKKEILTDSDKKPEVKEVTQQEEEIDEQQRCFVQSIPFANVYSAVLTLGKEKWIVAMNRDFYEPLLKALTNKKQEVSSILPILVATDVFATGFKPETATAFLRSIDRYKANNLIQLSAKKEETTSVTALPKDESGKKRLLLFSGVFLVLIGILVTVLLMTRTDSVPKRPGPAMPAQPGAAAPDSGTTVTMPVETAHPDQRLSQSTSLETLLSSSGSAELAQLAVEVIDAGGNASGAASLVEQLKRVGFENVSIGPAQSLTTGNMIVSASQEVPVPVLEALEQQLQEWGYSPSFQVSKKQTVAILIRRTNQ